MLFLGPLKSHEHSAKTNPKTAIIVDVIFLVITILLLILCNILIIANYGFDPLLLLPWVLLGGIIVWLICLIITSIKSLRNTKTKKK